MMLVETTDTDKRPANRCSFSTTQERLFSVLDGTGSALPAHIMKNSEFAESLNTNDEWIRTRTGIEQRHVASAEHGETTVSLAIAAGQDALRNSNTDVSEIDLVILATSTPNHSFPAGAIEIQGALGIRQGSGFDLQSACCGFVYAMIVADGMLRSGQSRAALVIGSETMSRLLDMEDRSTCVLFGDGAGAMVMRTRSDSRTPNNGKHHSLGNMVIGNGSTRSSGLEFDGSAFANGGDDIPSGLLGSSWSSIPDMKDDLFVDGGVSTTQSAGKIRMNGSRIFRTVTEIGPRIIYDVLGQAGLTVSDVDWFVPHQANHRILSAICSKIDLCESKLISTVDMHANTSTASIPLALHHGFSDGRVQKGQVVLFVAFGGGLTVGAAVMRV